MAIALLDVPITNTLHWTIELRNGAAGPVQLTLTSGQAATATLTFDRIRVITATLPHNTYVQNPVAPVQGQPGQLGYFRTGTPPGQPYVLTLARPGHADDVVVFT